MKNIIFLALAIIAEVAGTTALKISEQFTKPMQHTEQSECKRVAF